MFTEDYVSFETAKLLKEKEFDAPLHVYYSNDGLVQWMTGKKYTRNKELSTNACIRPTHQMVIKWLEEVHHILVIPDYIYECTDTSWVYKIYRLGKNGKPERCVVKGVSYDENNNPTEYIVRYRDYELSYKDYAKKEDAIEEGIKYCLENLI